MSDKQPCFHCREPIAQDALICPHCRRDARVDVRLNQAVADGRLRYRVARSLAAMGMGDFGTIQQALASPSPVVANRVARDTGARILDVLIAHGLEGVCEPTRGGDQSWAGAHRHSVRQDASRMSTALAALAIAVALVAAGWYAWSRKGQRELEHGLPSRAASAPRPAAQSEPPELTTRQIASVAMPATVSLRCENSVGSGFFVSPDLILTNAHVLCDRGWMKAILSDGREMQVTPVKTRRDVDLALVRIQGQVGTPIALGDAGMLAVGDKVVMVGSPFGLEFTVHEGLVSSLTRSIDGVAFIQLDAEINPGNSGGPLVDSHGRVVGIVSRKLAVADGIGLALPINYAYDKQNQLVAAPQGSAESAGFQTMVARAATDLSGGSEETDTSTPAEPLPMLVAVSVDQYDRLVAHVVIPAASQPATSIPVEFRLLVGTDEICVLKGDAGEWKSFEGNASVVGINPALIPVVLRRAQLGTLFLGEAPLRWDLCPVQRMRWGMVLELKGGDPDLARLQWRRSGSRSAGRRGSYRGY